jgi:hypothetical protein
LLDLFAVLQIHPWRRLGSSSRRDEVSQVAGISRSTSDAHPLLSLESPPVCRHLPADHRERKRDHLLLVPEIKLTCLKANQKTLVNALHKVHRIEVRTQCPSEKHMRDAPDSRFVACRKFTQRSLVAPRRLIDKLLEGRVLVMR